MNKLLQHINKDQYKVILTGKMGSGKTSTILSLKDSDLRVLVLLPNRSKVAELSSKVVTVTGSDNKEYKQQILKDVPSFLASTIDFYLCHRDELKDKFDLIVVDEAHSIITDSTFRVSFGHHFKTLCNDVNVFVSATPYYIFKLLEEYGFDYKVVTLEGEEAVKVSKVVVFNEINEVIDAVSYIQHFNYDVVLCNNKELLNYFDDYIKIWRGNVKDRWCRLLKYNFDVKIATTCVMNCGVNLLMHGKRLKVAYICYSDEDVYNVIQFCGRFRGAEIELHLFIVNKTKRLIHPNDLALKYYKEWRRSVDQYVNLIASYFNCPIEFRQMKVTYKPRKPNYSGKEIDFKPIGKDNGIAVVYTGTRKLLFELKDLLNSSKFKRFIDILRYYNTKINRIKLFKTMFDNLQLAIH